MNNVAQGKQSKSQKDLCIDELVTTEKKFVEALQMIREVRTREFCTGSIHPQNRWISLYHSSTSEYLPITLMVQAEHSVGYVCLCVRLVALEPEFLLT